MINLGAIDTRYVVVVAVLLAGVWVARKRPDLTVPVTIGLGAAALAYTILFS